MLTSLKSDEVYAATNILSGGDVVVKFRHLEMGRALQREYRIQKALASGIGIPRVWWFGTDFGIEAFVMDRMGPSLECLLSQKHSHKFPVVTVTGIGHQLVSCHACWPSCADSSQLHQISLLEFVHSCNLIHRHLKPSHILTGVKRSDLTLIDFGLARAYHDKKTHRHIAYKRQATFAGSQCFSSLRALRGRGQSRRDDLESVAYILIYLLCGALPWQDYQCTTDVIQSKADFRQSSLSDPVPPEFFSLLVYARSLAFDARPDYHLLRSYFDRFCADALTAANWGDI
jgi:serine/threonine protein kinase